jgi:hypothetical protein
MKRVRLLPVKRMCQMLGCKNVAATEYTFLNSRKRIRICNECLMERNEWQQQTMSDLLF